MKRKKDGWSLQMSDFDINFGPWLNYGKGDKENKIGEKMIELTSMSWSPFNGCEYAQVFIFCMAYAFAKGRKPNSPPSKGGGSMPASAFKKDMRDFMKVVAVTHKKDLDVITKPNEVVKICEGYAYASFLEVYNKIKTRDTSMSNEMILDQMLHEIESEREPRN